MSRASPVVVLVLLYLAEGFIGGLLEGRVIVASLVMALVGMYIMMTNRKAYCDIVTVEFARRSFDCHADWTGECGGEVWNISILTGPTTSVSVRLCSAHCADLKATLPPETES